MHQQGAGGSFPGAGRISAMCLRHQGCDIGTSGTLGGDALVSGQNSMAELLCHTSGWHRHVAVISTLLLVRGGDGRGMPETRESVRDWGDLGT